MDTLPTDAPVESLDAVPESYRSFFTQSDDGFVIADDFKAAAATINGLTKNLNEERTKSSSKNKEAADRRAALKHVQDTLASAGIEVESLSPESFNAETITGFIASQTSGVNDDLQARLAAQKEKLTQQAQSTLTAKDQEIEVMRGSLDRYLKVSQAQSAIAEHKGDAKLLMPFVSERLTVTQMDNGDFGVQVVNPDGTPAYGGTGDPMTPSELVASMKADPSYGRLFDADVPPGGGAMASRGPRSRQVSRDKASGKDLLAAGLAKL